jgi:hypothetical protein
VILSSDIDDNGTPDDDTDDIDLNIFERGVRQYHTGAEVEFIYRPYSWLKLQGYMSGGSWVYKGMTNFDVYNDETGDLLLSLEGVDRSGIHVSTAPQFSTGLGATAKVYSGLSVDGNINYRANHHEYTDLNTTEDSGVLAPFSLTDLGMTYNFQLGGQNMTFRANCYNIFDEVRENQTDAFGYYVTNGRTFNGSLKYNF